MGEGFNVDQALKEYLDAIKATIIRETVKETTDLIKSLKTDIKELFGPQITTINKSLENNRNSIRELYEYGNENKKNIGILENEQKNLSNRMDELEGDDKHKRTTNIAIIAVVVSAVIGVGSLIIALVT